MNYSNEQKRKIEEFKDGVINILNNDFELSYFLTELKKIGKQYNLSIYYDGNELCLNEYDGDDYDNMSKDMIELVSDIYNKDYIFDDYSNEVEFSWNPDKLKKVTITNEKLTPTNRKMEKTPMKKVKKVINNTKDALNETKKTIVKMQKGKAVLSAVKTSLINTPGIPIQVKSVLSMEGYGDLLTGLLLNIASSSLTSNRTIISAVRDANFVGSVEFSKQFTFFENLIENAITDVVGKLENVVVGDTDKE